MTNTGYPHLERDADGVLRVQAREFKVILLIGEHVYTGASAEQIAAAHPPLTLGEAHMVLAYYYDHKDTIDEELAARRHRAETLRAEIEAQQGPDSLPAKLRASEPEVRRRLA
jgi:hypothetical protein